MELDDEGLTKPANSDRIKALSARAIQEKNYALALMQQDQLYRKLEHERRNKAAKKPRSKIIAKCRKHMDRPHDPKSGDGGESLK